MPTLRGDGAYLDNSPMAKIVSTIYSRCLDREAGGFCKIEFEHKKVRIILLVVIHIFMNHSMCVLWWLLVIMLMIVYPVYSMRDSSVNVILAWTEG